MPLQRGPTMEYSHSRQANLEWQVSKSSCVQMASRFFSLDGRCSLSATQILTATTLSSLGNFHSGTGRSKSLLVAGLGRG